MPSSPKPKASTREEIRELTVFKEFVRNRLRERHLYDGLMWKGQDRKLASLALKLQRLSSIFIFILSLFFKSFFFLVRDIRMWYLRRSTMLDLCSRDLDDARRFPCWSGSIGIWIVLDIREIVYTKDCWRWRDRYVLWLGCLMMSEKDVLCVYFDFFVCIVDDDIDCRGERAGRVG